MTKNLHRILHWLILNLNFISEKVDTETYFSEDLRSVFEEIGCFTRPQSESKSFHCFMFRKRIYRLDKTGEYIGFQIPEWNEIGIRRKYDLVKEESVVFKLYFKPYALDWDIAVIRDKEIKKISLFNLKKQLKSVFWHDTLDYEREVAACKHFSKNNIDVLDYETTNPQSKSVTQNIVGMLGEHATELNPIDKQMLEYVLTSSHMKPFQTYKHDGLGMDTKTIIEAAEQHLKKSFLVHNNMCPQLLVHGDLSPFNIIRDGKKSYLIDFDRSFVASAYYDFVYVWLNKYDRNLSKLKDRIRKINDVYYGKNMVPESIALDLAISHFVMDNVRFINERCDTLNEARYIIYILNRLKERWPKQPIFFI
jgi:hypothetical protein